MSNTHNKIIMFYDETCIICRTEAKVMQEEHADKVLTIMVSDGIEQLASAGISKVDAMTYLCVQDRDGTIHTGMDACRLLYTTIDAWYARYLYLPVIKQVANVAYPIFARNRYYFPAWFTKLVFGTVAEADTCKDGICSVPPSKRKDL